jgi:hypothetical protein
VPPDFSVKHVFSGDDLAAAQLSNERIDRLLFNPQLPGL